MEDFGLQAEERELVQMYNEMENSQKELQRLRQYKHQLEMAAADMG